MSAAVKKKPTRKRASRARKKEIVFGLGATGLSVARYFHRTNVDAIYVDSREQPPGIAALSEIAPDAEVHAGGIPATLLKKASRVVASPGAADSEPFLRAAREAGLEIVSDIELFVAAADAPIVGVTGSNGKSTVTTLLALMCEASGRKVQAGGNLGVPALDLLTEETPQDYLLELSSFQLQRTQNLPLKVAVLLNISPDHLDWHESEAQYREAKYRIFDEAECAVINRLETDGIERLRKDQPTFTFGLDVPDENGFGIVADEGEEFLARGEQLLLACSDVAMFGAHNRANALAALAAGDLMGLPTGSMLQVLNEFPGLPHRMQAVTRSNEVLFVNDSKATNVGAAIAAVLSVPAPVVLIAGGQGKGGNFEALAKSTGAHLRLAILIGEDANQLAHAFAGHSDIELAANLQAAVSRAAEVAQPGDTVLLAPACASFDQFRSFEHRGDDFCRFVMGLKR